MSGIPESIEFDRQNHGKVFNHCYGLLRGGILGESSGVYIDSSFSYAREHGDDTSEQLARLVTASYNSYKRNFGTNTVAAAESDLLGRALDALRKVEPFVERLVAANKDDRELAELVINIDDILSKAGV